MFRPLFVICVILGILPLAELKAHGGRFRNPVPMRGNTPISPGKPATPALPAVTGTGPVGIVPGPAVTASSQIIDTYGWEIWWDFNREPFLDLRARIFTEEPSTGESDVLTGLEGAIQTEGYRPLHGQVVNKIIPALQVGLQSGKTDIVSGSLLALAKVSIQEQADAQVQAFRPFLRDEQEISETAALAFGILQSPKALDTLVELLRDSRTGRRLTDRDIEVDTRVRTFSAYGLGLIGSASEKRALTAYIESVLWDVLQKGGEPTPDIGVACVISLGLLQTDQPVPLVEKLLAFLNDELPDHLIRAHVPNAVARLLKHSTNWQLRETAIKQFLELLDKRSTKTEVRQSCAQTLGVLVPANSPLAPQVVETLLHATVEDNNRMVRNFALMSLAYIAADGGPSDPLVYEKILPLMLKRLNSGATLERPWYGLALGVMVARGRDKGYSAWPSVVTLGVRERFRVTKAPLQRSAFAISLGLMEHQNSKSLLHSAMMNTQEPEFRGYCATALGLMGAKEHAEDIRKILAGSRRKPDLLQRVAIGLGLMGDKQSVPVLVELIRPQRGGTPPLAVMAAAATALGFIGDRRAVDPLVHILENPDMKDLARAFAAVALGTVANKEMLPWNSKIAEDLNYIATVPTLTDPANQNGILDLL